MSDRAKALIHLAREKFNVSSVADLFHLKYCINKLLTLALSSKLMSAKTNYESSLEKKDDSLKTTGQAYAQIQFYTDLYVESVEQISHSVHPFYSGNQINSSERATEQIQNQMGNIKQIVSDSKITDTYKLLEKAENQIPDATCVIDLWWDLVRAELATINFESRDWFNECLLPKTYWETTLKKTNYKTTIDKIKQELNICKTKENQMNYPQLQSEEMTKYKEKALELCRQFQRSSSQVEGRNGYLSLINHTQRGFDEKRLKVLTVVHNYDIRGLDDKTPAERLFKNQIEHESIFEYLINNIQELPLSRKTKINSTVNQSCPTLCG